MVVVASQRIRRGGKVGQLGGPSAYRSATGNPDNRHIAEAVAQNQNDPALLARFDEQCTLDAKADLPDVPFSTTPGFARVQGGSTAIWTQGEIAYLALTKGNEAFLQKLIPSPHRG